MIACVLAMLLSGCSTVPQTVAPPAWDSRNAYCMGGPKQPPAVSETYFEGRSVSRYHDFSETDWERMFCSRYDVDGDGDVDLLDVCLWLNGE